MNPETLGAILVALLSGGVVAKIIERVLDFWFNRGRSLRDELRIEIDRLEKNIRELQDRVNSLEEEVEEWKSKVDEWREKYYDLLESYKLLKIAAAAKDRAIAQLREEIKRLKGEKDAD